MDRKSPHFPRNVSGYGKAIENLSDSRLDEELVRLRNNRANSSYSEHYAIDQMIQAVLDLQSSNESINDNDLLSSPVPSQEARDYARREIEEVARKKSEIKAQVKVYETEEVQTDRNQRKHS